MSYLYLLSRQLICLGNCTRSRTPAFQPDLSWKQLYQSAGSLCPSRGSRRCSICSQDLWLWSYSALRVASGRVCMHESARDRSKRQVSKVEATRIDQKTGGDKVSGYGVSNTYIRVQSKYEKSSKVISIFDKPLIKVYFKRGAGGRIVAGQSKHSLRVAPKLNSVPRAAPPPPPPPTP